MAREFRRIFGDQVGRTFIKKKYEQDQVSRNLELFMCALSSLNRYNVRMTVIPWNLLLLDALCFRLIYLKF